MQKGGEIERFCHLGTVSFEDDALMRFDCFFFSSRRRHTRFDCDWSSDVCSSDLSTASGSDRRHVVNLSTVAETPQFASPMLRRLASAWQLSGIIKLMSGTPMTVTRSEERV